MPSTRCRIPRRMSIGKQSLARRSPRTRELQADPEQPAKKSADEPLQSLTPKYVAEDHGIYLRRLEEAVKDPKNLNIALTGRYGAGKSSVLDEFAAKHDKAVLRLCISTLAPGEEGESTTNRIQKEIVKQLLYGASEKVGKNSRFNKIAVLSRRKAFLQSSAVVLPVLGLAYVFGVLPQLKWPAADAATWQRVATWVTAVGLITVLATVIRLMTYGRYDVKEASAGGAALTLSEKPQTFFDKYIDEIVHYFAQESKDIVILEDLDRFEDPNIFEALRELNVLLNDTPERRKKRRGNLTGRAFAGALGWINEDWPGQLEKRLPYPWAGRLLGRGEPLRFIYAVRDSVFSKIDSTPVETPLNTAGSTTALTPAREVDEAAAETLRANRTKFFDIVIPLVPFISHRNALDLLVKLLKERGITGVDARLVNTVAQHCTDMRLMRNMCNEYLVFSERLLEPVEPNKPAPGLDATHLFALVAYNNFHLEYFENITRRDSDLDTVYGFAQRLTRDTISSHERRIRDLLARPERFRAREPLAKQLGQRLDLLATNVRAARSPQYGSPYTAYRFKVGNQEFGADKLDAYVFWAAVAKARSLDIVLTQQSGRPSVGHTFDEAELKMFVPEALDGDRWATFDKDAVATEVATKEDDIDALRRADFADLAKTQFKMTLRDGEAASRNLTSLEDPGGPQSFADLIEATLKSELARDLVRRGYIDRNFSLYAAQFYGNFTGVDVANFMVQHVQPNVMNIDYDLSRAKDGDREGAAANLLLECEEAGEDVLNTVAAYNIDLVNHLLETGGGTGEDGAATVAKNLVAGWPGPNARSFLAAYFTSKKAHRERFAALLARCRWRDVYTYLSSDDDVPTDVRVAVVDAALKAFDPDATYELGEGMSDFIATHYREMSVFSGDHPLSNTDGAPGYLEEQPAERPLERVDALLHRADVIFPELQPLRPDVLKRAVAGSRYQITANNLRTALGLKADAGVPFEMVRSDKNVYEYCCRAMSAYLTAIDDDEHTGFAVSTPDTLVAVLKDLVVAFEDEEIADAAVGKVASLLAHTAPAARLRLLQDAPKSTWTALAAANLFRASLANVEAYRTCVGSVDDHLSGLLQNAGTVHVDENGDTTDTDGQEYARDPAAIAILNAAKMAPPAKVWLANSLHPTTPLPVESIDAGPNDLFARLIEIELVEDTQQTFDRLRVWGWAALGPAITVSANITSFLNPDLLEGVVGTALTDPETAPKVAKAVLGDVDGYVPADDWGALRAVATYADTHNAALAPPTVALIARVGHNEGDLDVHCVLRLLSITSPAATAADIVETFRHLGPPYKLITETGKRFDVDYDELHDKLLRVLDSAGVISRGTLRVPRRRYGITVR